MIWKITFIGLLAGVIGTGLGGIISAIFRKNVNKYLDFFMGLSGGIMLAVVVFDLLKESINEIGIIFTVIATFIGALISMFIKDRIHVEGSLKAGYLIFISILLHNLPEGLAIGSSFMSAEKLGITLAIVIGLHNIPEGLAMGLSLVGGKVKIMRMLLMTIIAGIPMGLGSFLGAYFGSLFHALIGVFLAVAGGTMMYVTLEEIFPSSKSMYSIFGFLVGMIIVQLI